ncbi:testis-expressed protein 49 [Kryptolebias marmoratus]|uniref:testis-expressed protein 49 n=1 Tax=Kryptolebias marmoratus TaxID=37003 RepID=UPI000D52F884|nr:testis-expressed protein 49 [Kryptolebias marmoratus]
MAFFGLTHLGYQDPIGDKMIIKPRGASMSPGGSDNFGGGSPPSLQDLQGPLRPADMSRVYLQPLPFGSDIHRGSHEKYKEMVKRARAVKPPNQLYVTPLTDNQQYGWMASGTPEPWTQVRRFPRKFSEMTKFVKDMSTTDREFSLF